MSTQAGQETMWSQKWPPRPVRRPGGAVSRAGLPPLDPELQRAPLWPSSATALAVRQVCRAELPRTMSRIPGSSRFLGPPRLLLLSRLPEADCAHVPCSPLAEKEPRLGLGRTSGCPSHRTRRQGSALVVYHVLMNMSVECSGRTVGLEADGRDLVWA